ncbi:hypothetical protein ASPFODRAFT_70076 [Aspergillus luchuensis CBS 106.47]|uniref:Uncharacterized protein n=1 Tax=Aspergillus luchuensis (strain CBS 106.47) TaxID=1137211 RepID=A0A1M3TJW3_ASPLC|nr:hypothetical protein ASPFODRAFT_70076 [Aspergillus luchuensis CBS 106.47]
MMGFWSCYCPRSFSDSLGFKGTNSQVDSDSYQGNLKRLLMQNQKEHEGIYHAGRVIRQLLTVHSPHPETHYTTNGVRSSPTVHYYYLPIGRCIWVIMASRDPCTSAAAAGPLACTIPPRET